jgi:iron only hydrogenase large subunit-like protein
MFCSIDKKIQYSHRPEQIYHVSVMPCYDKKLEASRSDFYNAAADSRDVDCVLTTGELDALFRQEGHSLSFSSQSDRPPSPLEPHPSKASLDLETTLPSLIPARGSSSGGYLRAVLEAVHVQNPGSTVEVVKPTADAEELVLRAGTGEVLFRAARCFGFRNVQNMVRRVGRETGVRTARGAAGRMGGAGAVVRRRAAAGGAEANSKDTGRLDYVEVMACPGGCVNGGGQLPPPSQQSEPKDAEGYTRDWESEGVRVQGYAGRWGGKEWTAQVEKMYWAGGDGDGPTPPSGDGVDFGTSLSDINTSELASRIIRDICGDDVNGEERRHRLLRTDYRAVESEVLGIAVKW